MRKGTCYLLICLFCSLKAFGQPALAEDVFWEGPDTDTIPVEVMNGAMVITLKIKQRPYRFIFDTGAGLSVSEDLFKKNRFRSTGSRIIRDATGNINTSKKISIPQLALGRFRLSNCAADVMDYRKSSFFKCQDIDGLIGGDVFKNCLLEIDLKHNRLIVASRPELTALRGNERPVEFDNQYSPIFHIRLKDHFTLKVLFDTGAEDLLTIPANVYEESSHYCGYRELRRGKYSLAGAHNVTVKDDYKILSLDSLQFGQLRLRLPEVCVVARTDISILGLDILKYGVMRLDYRSSKFSFIPYAEESVFEKEDNFPGFSVGRENSIYVVNGIEFGSEADICGMGIGMQITRISNIDLTSYSPGKDCRILKKKLAQMKEVKVEYLDHNRRKNICTLIKPGKPQTGNAASRVNTQQL